MMFRVNFLVRCAAGLGWLALLVFFFHIIYLRTERIGDWNRYEFLFFLGVSMLLNNVINTFFLDNCTNFSELIRKGDLDFALLKPIDEQFLVSCQRVDWSEAPKAVVGLACMFISTVHTGNSLALGQIIALVLLLLAGTAIFYSLLISMAASSVWMVQNTGLYEAWFYVTQFARYPSDVYGGNWLGTTIRYGLSYVVPVFLAVNIPARYGARLAFDGWLVAYLCLGAVACLAASRWFFRKALKAYRSASS